jgi:hypothetical protein
LHAFIAEQLLKMPFLFRHSLCERIVFQGRRMTIFWSAPDDHDCCDFECDKQQNISGAKKPFIKTLL